MERIFIDKLFAAEAYVRKSAEKSRVFEAAKHIYDLAVMIKLPKIQELMMDEEQLERLLNIRMTEELDRHDGIPYKNALNALWDIKYALEKNNAWNKAVVPNQAETESVRHSKISV